MKTDYINVKFYIWDTAYKIDDYGDHLIVTIPCTKRDKLGGETLSSYKEKVKDPNTINFIRKLIENDQIALFAKNDITSFSFEEIMAGIPTQYGWELADFY